MASTPPPDASAETLEEELAFLDVLIESLDEGADDYESRLAEFEDQKADFERRLQSMNAKGPNIAGSMDMGMDSTSDFWPPDIGGPTDSAQRLSDGNRGSSSTQSNGLKRSLNGDSGQYPSKRPTPDPSNVGTPTSSTGSFEWIDHPQKPPQPPQAQAWSDKARQRHLAAEAAMKRQREEREADERCARQLFDAQSQFLAGSSSSSRPNVQTTLNPSGSFTRPPRPSPSSALPSIENMQMHKPVRPHVPPSPMVKQDSGPSKQQQQYSSPLTTRIKPSMNVVDLTGSDSDNNDDVAEVAPTSFSPNYRRDRPRPQPHVQYQNRPPFDSNTPPYPSQLGSLPMQPPARSMPGVWPTAVEVPSSNNGYVYNQNRSAGPDLPTWLHNSNTASPTPRGQFISTPYNGARGVGGDMDSRMAEAAALFTPGARPPQAGPSRRGGVYGGANGGGNGGGIPGAYPGANSGAMPGAYGGAFSGFSGAIQSDEEDEDDDVIFGGSRPRPAGSAFGPPWLPGGMPAGYPNQEAYRQRFDEMMNQNPAKTMEEINALMENIRPDEDTPEHLRVKTPKELCITLHKYQELGLTWLQRCETGNHRGGILADDMGLGKTIQMLSLIVTQKSPDPRCKTTLIIAPVALMRQWKQEIETRLRANYRLTVQIHHGASRKKDFQALRHFDIVLTTFGTLTAEFKKLEKFALRKRMDPNAYPRPAEKTALLGDDARWYRVVLDEAQCIKNNNTQGAKAACRLHTQYRFCMTGTPMMNNVDELWSLIHFLRIKPYCERHHFQRDFTKRLKAEYSRDDAMKALQALIRSIMLRRTKQSKFEGQPILTLPERTTNIDNPVFSEDEAAFYKALEDRSALQFNKYLRNGTVGSSYSAILVLLLRLRQACCHPHLIKDFGVSAAAGVSPETLIDLAKHLDRGVVERIKATKGNFECPVCYDAVTNPAIFVPCGHDTCQECFAKIADNAARNGEGGGAVGNAKCPNCRGEINSKRITDFESFKKVHMPDQLTEEEQAELQRLYDNSETEDEDSETESDDEDKDEVSSDGDLARFVVADKEDAQDSENESEAGLNVKAEGSGEDDVVASGRETSSSKSKGKKKEESKKPKKPQKSKKAKGKKREKGENKKVKTTKTLAELKKDATRSAKGRRDYIKKLNEEWVTSAKIEKTMELLKEIMEDPKGEKVLIFSQWTSLLDLLECPIYREGWGYRRYDGSMNAGMRGDAVDDFRDTRKDVRIMLVSLKAGNAGLNLNMASQVIILDPFWNP